MRPTTLKLLTALFCCMLAYAAQAQTSVDITLDRNGDQFPYDLEVLNTSPTAQIESVQVSLIGGAEFDTESSNIFVSQVSPDIGDNNDGLSASTVTWTPGNPMQSGDLLRINGDIDPGEQADEVIATVNFTSGDAQTVSLSLSGDRWTGRIGDPPAPALIINGQATATMTWTPPTAYEDGSPLALSEIEGFVLYWDEQSRVNRCGAYPNTKLDSQCYGSSLDLGDGTLTTQPLTLSLDGDTTVYFAIVAYLTDGDGDLSLSRYSNEAMRDFIVDVVIAPDPNPGAPQLIDVVMDITCTTNQANVTCNFTVQ